MNRKLHNSMLAFTAAGVMFVLTLMAAGPAPSGRDMPATLAAVVVHAPAVDIGADAAALERSIEIRARQLEDDLDQSASLGDTVATVIGFAAAVSTESALGAAIEATSEQADARREAARERRRHARQVRGALAVPYFSFAQGLRRGSRS